MFIVMEPMPAGIAIRSPSSSTVNPEFGSFEDFKRFVDRAHELGLRVILDWVANHSAWDNPLVSQHPEWYERDWKGDFHPT
ncbi:MAG: hypothetical protein EB021_08600, partial [Gammaproteobacteria bacterium]|nr:hypothetical protein [Gammaproteobacteria bacterium]